MKATLWLLHLNHAWGFVGVLHCPGPHTALCRGAEGTMGGTLQEASNQSTWFPFVMTEAWFYDVIQGIFDQAVLHISLFFIMLNFVPSAF